MKSYLFCLIAIFIANDLTANNTPYHFLRTTQSARSSSLAGASVVLEDDPGSIYFNPALIYTVEEQNLSFTGFQHVLDITSGNAVYVEDRFIDELGVLAANIHYRSYGVFDYADENGFGQGTFGGGDFSFGLGISNELDSNLYYGITAKFLYVGLDDNVGTAFAVDAGLFYRLNDRSNIGISVLNAGTQITRLNGEDTGLPLDIRIGANHKLRGLPLLANISLHHLADDNEDGILGNLQNISAGLELYLGKYLRLRGGFDNMIRRDVSPEFDKRTSGFTFGLGAKLNTFNLDYGLARFGAAGYLHRLTVNLGV